MSNGAGWPPDDPGGFGQGGRHTGDDIGADRDDGDSQRYFDDSGYGWTEASGRSPGQGDPRGPGRTDPYGQSAGRHSGRHSSASYDDGYGRDALGQGAYQQDSYGQDWTAANRYQGDQHGHDGYDRGGYGQGSYGQAGYGSYGEQGYGHGGYGHDQDQYGRGSYDQDGYSPEGYGQNGYGGEYYGQPPPRPSVPGPDGYGRDGYRQDGLSTDSYGRDLYAQEGRGAPGSYRALGGYVPPDGYDVDNGYSSPTRPARPALGAGPDPDVTASYRPDTGSLDGGDGRDSGWFSQPSDSGSFARPDTGSFARPDTGSFARPDTGSFARPDAASFGSAQGYQSDVPHDPFGPPAASLRRTEPGGQSVGQDSVRPGGYDQWHEADEADSWDGDDQAEHEDDWQEDPDGGLLSKRFGGGAGGGGRDRGNGRRAARARRPKRLRGKFAVTAAILAGALVLGAVADYGYERFQTWHTGRYGDYPGVGNGQVRFTVPPGAALSSLGLALMKAGVIMEVRPFDSAAAAAQNASHLQPGVYLLHRHMSAADAVQFLLGPGHRINDQITIIEGVRASAIAQALAKQTGIPVAQFTNIIDHPPASLGLPSWARGKTAEGFLFPDTYTLLPKMTPLAILKMMVTEFNQKVASINLVSGSQKVFTTPWHALIVASLIQAEAGNTSDFGKISRVVWNRLIDKMPLEFDSTVFYAMGKYGTAVNASQRNFPSPYNTYLHTGLPPGPIGNPGALALQAAVHATHGPWLYFITDTRHKPYLTHFTASLSQLQAWQREFHN